MARHTQEKCRLCAKLTAEEAQRRHGPQGDGCWSNQHCHNRRSYYKHRDRLKQQRRDNYRGNNSLPEQSIAPTVLQIASPLAWAGVVHWYRETKTSPLHALGAQLWLGNQKVATVEPLHCLGLTESQVKQVLVQILQQFSQQAGQPIERFRSSVEFHPHHCPIHPCPLKPEYDPSR